MTACFALDMTACFALDMTACFALDMTAYFALDMWSVSETPVYFFFEAFAAGCAVPIPGIKPPTASRTKLPQVRLF